MSLATSCVRCVKPLRCMRKATNDTHYSWRCYLTPAAADVAGGAVQHNEVSFIGTRVCSSESHLTSQRPNFTDHLTIYNIQYTNKWASVDAKPLTCMPLPLNYSPICTHMTLTFDLWPWQHLQQFSLIRWKFAASLTEIIPPSKEISYH